jgi:U3 small nucleolar RNA-associated protein 5
MASADIRGILTSFSPSLDFFAITSGDGRIKIWDTVKGQVQTEFADLVSSDATELFSKPKGGHLSVDYTCMKWLSVEKTKKKRKISSSLLVLGTGSGDVLALDVAAGHLIWRVSDCNPGGVSSISFPANGSCIYTAGADGMICQLDSMTGNSLGKFKVSAKAIHSMAVSSDGRLLATASAQLKIFNCSDRKKLQKFSGHPGAVRCIIFSEDGKYIFSSSVGERYVAVWKRDGSKKQSASCALAMDQPAVVLDCKCVGSEIYVLAITEIGVCYFWYAKDIEELRSSKPTKVFAEKILNKGTIPTILSAKLQGVPKPACGSVFISHGLLVKPSFEKILVQPGADVMLTSSVDGILLPLSKSQKSKKGSGQNRITALDRSNAEDAILPIPKIFNPVDKIAVQHVMTDDEMVVDEVSLNVEERLRSLGILRNNEELTSNTILDFKVLKDINVEAIWPQRKMREYVLSMTPSNAYKLLKDLLFMWQSRLGAGKFILPWICCLLVHHSDFIISQEPATQVLDSLNKLTTSKTEATHSLLQLSGRLQLIKAQINKAANNKIQSMEQDHKMDDSEDEDEDEEAEEFVYGEDDDDSSDNE